MSRRRSGPIAVWALLITDDAAQKLGARGISEAAAHQLVDNRYEVLRNTGQGHNVRELHERRLLVGSTDGGRVLTLVIERTIDPTTWLVITGWDSSATERRIGS